MRRNTLELEPNVPVTVALKYQSGRAIANGRVMFSTTEDEVFFVSPEEAHRIHALGLQQYEPMRILKRVQPGQKPVLLFENATTRGQEPPPAPPKQQQPGIPAPAAAAHVSAPVPPPSTTSAPERSASSNSYTSILTSCYLAAIDAIRTAKEYADTKGVPFAITADQISTSANSIFIEFHKAQERKLRYPQPQNGGASTWQRQ